jgi:UDP-glucose:(heptosyl)LPS alpha-1,3-glucosyltransferase
MDFDRVMGFGRHAGHDLFRAGGGSHAAYLRRVHPWRRWLDPTDWVEQWADAKALGTARIVVANSQLCAADIRKDFPSVRVEVVYNGVDSQRFSPDPEQRATIRRELGADGPVAIFLGTGFHRKGLDVAIAALPLGWTLWVVGEGRPIPAPPTVRYLGPARDPERFLRGADVMLLPTRYDPFANACLEAMACGLPVLTTPTNGAAEVLPESWMICQSPEEFRAGLLKATPELGQRCRAIAESHPREASFAQTFALLKEAR